MWASDYERPVHSAAVSSQPQRPVGEDGVMEVPPFLFRAWVVFPNPGSVEREGPGEGGWGARAQAVRGVPKRYQPVMGRAVRAAIADLSHETAVGLRQDDRVGGLEIVYGWPTECLAQPTTRESPPQCRQFVLEFIRSHGAIQPRTGIS